MGNVLFSVPYFFTISLLTIVLFPLENALELGTPGKTNKDGQSCGFECII